MSLPDSNLWYLLKVDNGAGGSNNCSSFKPAVVMSDCAKKKVEVGLICEQLHERHPEWTVSYLSSWIFTRSSSGFYFATIVNWTKILIGVQWKYEETNIRFTAAQNGFLFRKAARNTGFMCILFMKQLDLLSTNEAF